MAKSTNRGRGRNGERGVMELARERPFAAAAAAAGAAAAGLFLWSKRAQIGEQLGHLTDQIGEWTDAVRSDNLEGDLEMADKNSPDIAKASRSSSTGRGRAQPTSVQ